MDDLQAVARALVAPGKGILAADESTGTIKKRFDAVDAESTEDSRREYREMLFTAPGIADSISGVILYDETLRQRAADGTPLVQVLERRRIIPGIKVDAGAKPLAFAPDETVTEGLDGLRDRLQEYRGLGARFAKWRATYAIGDGTPSQYCIDVNAHTLARYAVLCQEVGLVPIVEPEVLMDGAHTIERCHDVTAAVLQAVFQQLFAQRVFYEGMLLKPNMVVAGKDCRVRVTADQVAAATLRCFRWAVPAAVPGIVFLSGGQTDQDATANLDAMNKRKAAGEAVPWELSFSYGRALQSAALEAWKGEAANASAGQAAFAHRARLNGEARRGRYAPDMEHASR